MSKSVSNDALWEKLSEVDEKLDRLLIGQKTSVPTQESIEIIPDFKRAKEEIITGIKDEIRILGWSSDSHFEANRKNIAAITEIIQKVWNIVSRIRKQQRETVESQEKEKESHLNFWFFKVRKTSVVIAILGLLIFILTLFCMKQQNDYSLLMDEYYKQSIEIKEIQVEVKTVKNK
jgi:hypothetical protein